MARTIRIGPRSLVAPQVPPPVDPALARPWGRTFKNAQNQTVDLFPGVDQPSHGGIQQPLVYIDSTPPTYSGAQATPIVVTARSAFTAAWVQADAAGGGIIELDPDTFVANYRFNPGNANDPGFWPSVFPQRTTSGWITIRCRSTKVPPGAPARYTRVNGGNQSLREALPTWSGSGTGGSYHALYVPSTASFVRFELMHFVHDTDDGSNQMTSLTGVDPDAHHVVFDRCVWSAKDQWDTKAVRGLDLRGYHVAVVDSYFWGFKTSPDTGATDAQAINTQYSRGPLKIVNTYLEGTGENYITGGSSVRAGNTPEFFPKDLEFRRNHCRHPQGHNCKHPAFRDRAVKVAGPFTVTDYLANNGLATQSAEVTISGLGGQTFDTTLVSSAAYTHYFIRVISGPGAGSWWEIRSYPSTTVVRLERDANGKPSGSATNLHNGAPDVGSVFEIAKATRWMCKNLFELKIQERAYVAENVFENHWAGDDNQPDAFLLKSVNQNDILSNEPYTKCEDIIAVDNVLMNVYGGINLNANPQGRAQAAQRMYFDNWLLLAGEQQFIIAPGSSDPTNRSRPVVNTGVDGVTCSRMTNVGFWSTWMTLEPTTSSDNLSLIESLTIRRYVGAYGSLGFRLEQASTLAEAADLATFVADATAVVRSTSAPGMPTGTIRSATFGHVNPDREALFEGADYGYTAGHPFANVGGAPIGCDWTQLKQRTQGVRSPHPYEWGLDIKDGPTG